MAYLSTFHAEGVFNGRHKDEVLQNGSIRGDPNTSPDQHGDVIPEPVLLSRPIRAV